VQKSNLKLVIISKTGAGSSSRYRPTTTCGAFCRLPCSRFIARHADDGRRPILDRPWSPFWRHCFLPSKVNCLSDLREHSNVHAGRPAAASARHGRGGLFAPFNRGARLIDLCPVVGRGRRQLFGRVRPGARGWITSRQHAAGMVGIVVGGRRAPRQSKCKIILYGPIKAVRVAWRGHCCCCCCSCCSCCRRHGRSDREMGQTIGEISGRRRAPYWLRPRIK
jgi:hypothetical protein